MPRESSGWANGRLQRARPRRGAFAFMQQQDGSADRFPVEQIDAEAIHGAVVRWCGQGYAISFGLSGDGGAFGIHLLAGGEKRSRWCAAVGEAEDFLSTVPGAQEK